MSEIQTTAWSETTGSGANNTAAPDGWPEGMLPSGVNDSGRGMMAALKRWFNRMYGLTNAGALISSAGTAPNFTVTFDNAPASLYTAFEFEFKAHAAAVGSDAVNVNSLGSITVKKGTTGGLAVLSANDWVVGQHVKLKYDATAAAMIMMSPLATGLADPMTTRGDIIVRNSSNATARLAVGSANTVLKSDGTDPAYGKVTVAMLTTGTDGELITWDSSGNPATVAVGTSGHVLTSNGAGAAPTFQASQAGWAVLDEETASASATLDFVLTSHLTNYEDFEFILVNIVPATNGVELLIRTSTDGGSTYDSAAADYNWAVNGTDEDNISIAEASASATSIQLNGSATISNVASDGVAGRITCYNPASTAHACKFTWHIHYGDGADWNDAHGSGNRQAAADVDAVRFLMSSGNITSGKIVLVGRRKFS